MSAISISTISRLDLSISVFEKLTYAYWFQIALEIIWLPV